MQTLREMRRLTIEAIQTQIPRQKALDLMRGFMPADPGVFADVLRNWFLIVVGIVDEFEEVLISPLAMLREIAEKGNTFGDCDDAAMLAAAMLASVGASVRFAAVNRNPDGSYAHVFCQYRFPRADDWIDFDPTLGYDRPQYDETDMVTMDIVS